MTNRPSLDDYVDVAERVMAFMEKYPEGSLQTIDWEIRTVDNQTFVVYRAAAFRNPTDARPGHGTAWEPFPGPTPYTRNSELMNAETAAWGRAIIACGIPAGRRLASRQGVKARQADAVSSSDVEALKNAAKGLKLGQIKSEFEKLNILCPEPFSFSGVPRPIAPVLAKALTEIER